MENGIPILFEAFFTLQVDMIQIQVHGSIQVENDDDFIFFTESRTEAFGDLQKWKQKMF